MHRRSASTKMIALTHAEPLTKPRNHRSASANLSFRMRNRICPATRHTRYVSRPAPAMRKGAILLAAFGEAYGVQKHTQPHAVLRQIRRLDLQFHIVHASLFDTRRIDWKAYFVLANFAGDNGIEGDTIDPHLNRLRSDCTDYLA